MSVGLFALERPPRYPLALTGYGKQCKSVMMSGCHMVGGWETDEPVDVAVVNSGFCADHHVYLRIQERKSWAGNEFDISDEITKQPWFQLSAKAGGCRRKTLVDLGGDVIATLRSPAILHGLRMHVKGRGFSFQVCFRLCQGYGSAAVVRCCCTFAVL